MSLVSALPKSDLENHTGLMDYVSPTRLNTWLSCPLKFRLKYLDGIKEPTSPGLFLGKRVHSALEFVYRHRQNRQHVTVADVSNHIAESWEGAAEDEAMRFDGVDDEDALKKQAIGLVQMYLDQGDPDEGFPIAVETKLQCPLIDPETGEDLGINLFGFVDLVLESPSGIVIVDFKTAARSTAPLDVTHEVQLSSYAYAFRRVFGERERELQIRSLIKTKTPKIAVHHYPAHDARHFRRLFAVIRSYLDGVRSQQFVFRPSWNCAMCDHRDTHCQAWQG